MKYVFSFFLVFLCYGLMAQSGGVAVYKDPRIDLLIKKQGEVNNLSTRNSAKRRTAPGYRILVISTNNKAEAIAARTKIYSGFPELKPYMWHQSPYFKVKAGNFTSWQDAQVYQKKLAALFPNGVFIMSDVVEVDPDSGESED
ncbi:SPOR domain-containing protein [Niabella hirudinis]|uniref:SPOR domain-containing protein n=1 Tax=Niabella hirudinis TaxID=1285929 RepID=UPI003EB7448D